MFRGKAALATGQAIALAYAEYGARLEPMGVQNIQLGYGLGMGTEIGFRLVH